jgi:aryl-alcohol dehydrogenase-like predicted oxidoreductase
MEMTTLGMTGLPVSRIGLGLAAVGRPAYITTGRNADLGADRSVEALRRRCHELLDTASALGIRYVDVARSYGLAEQFLAEWLERGVAVPTIGSKWGYRYVGDWRIDAPIHEVKDHSLTAFRRQLAESRSLLGPALRLYQVHSATLESGILDDSGVLDALARLRQDGLHVGLSVSGPRQSYSIQRALDVRVDGVNPFSAVQATWNVLEPSAGNALTAASAAGWGVIVKEALANGRLAHGPDTSPIVAGIAARHATTPDAVAIAAALRQTWATVVLSGAATTDQLRSNVASIDVALTDVDAAALGGLAEDPVAYWASRSRRAGR